MAIASCRRRQHTNCLCCEVSFQEHIDSPVMEAMQTGCRYHCGSIACGSGLNIIVYFLKIAFRRIRNPC